MGLTGGVFICSGLGEKKQRLDAGTSGEKGKKGGNKKLSANSEKRRKREGEENNKGKTKKINRFMNPGGGKGKNSRYQKGEREGVHLEKRGEKRGTEGGWGFRGLATNLLGKREEELRSRCAKEEVCGGMSR